MTEAIFRERLQAIIDWADLAMKNRAEFDSHGVRNLDCPVFDAAREALAASSEPFPQPSRKDGDEPCGECHIQPGETCDICGAINPPPAAQQVHELDEACYNVAFDRGESTHLHLGMQVTFDVAQDYVSRFREEYVGKPYPNGKGWYPFTNPRVVIVTQPPAARAMGDNAK